MKAVLISIQPKWCELIASGKKTVEVRKTKPKLETPFKVYIYETKDKNFENIGIHWADGKDFVHNIGKVIGEFVCDRISVIDAKNLHDYCQGCEAAFIDDLSPCDYSLEKIPEIGMSSYELSTYIRDKDGYEWHISDLIIYDKPKELSEFIKIEKCPYAGLASCLKCKEHHCFTKPPQSWCYVERLGEGVMSSQMRLFPAEENPEKKLKRNWENAFQKWSNDKLQEKSSPLGKCGYGSMCDYCADNSHGRPCVRALNAMCRDTGITIDYNNRNFEEIWYM